MKTGLKLPEVTFHTREKEEGGYQWRDRTTSDFFAGKRAVLFALPGAFTPTCTNQQLPGFEKGAATFAKYGIADIYCLAVNDPFVMTKWAEQEDLHHVQMIPDGNGQFTRLMGMLVLKEGAGFGHRSWRYAAVVNDGVIEAWFEEPGRGDNTLNDHYGVSDASTVLDWLAENG